MRQLLIIAIAVVLSACTPVTPTSDVLIDGANYSCSVSDVESFCSVKDGALICSIELLDFACEAD